MKVKMIVTDEVLEKILPKAIRKHNSWYQDGFLFIKLNNDSIILSTIDEENKNKFVIDNNIDILYDYLAYLKHTTSTKQVNNYKLKTKRNLICKPCRDKN